MELSLKQMGFNFTKCYWIILIVLLISSYSHIKAQSLFNICLPDGNLNHTEVTSLSQVLAHQIMTSAKSTEIAFGKTTGFPFDGSFDWHSSIHAHWALLSIARKTQNEEFKQFVVDRIKADDLIKINNQTLKRKQFPTQYGLSWFLLLLQELELTQQYNNTLLTKIKIDTVARLKSYLSRNKKVSGNYKSKMFTLFVAKIANVEIYEKKEIEHKRYTKRLTLYQEGKFDFLDPMFLYKLVNNHEVTNIRPFHIPEKIELEDAHNFGFNFSSVWIDLNKYSGTAKFKYCKEIEFRIQETLTNRAIHEMEAFHKFVRFDHWVPQFMWMPFHLTLD